MNRPQKHIWPALLLISLTTLAYLPAMRGEFVFDDELYITENPLIRARDGLRRFWLSTGFTDYYALANTTLWLEWRLWGANPTGYHLSNVLLHALNSLLLWRLLGQLRTPAPWVAAAVFALHPVNVSSVAWISERKNVLSMLFLFLTMHAWLRFDRSASRRWYSGSLALFVLALLSKTAVVMLPVVLLGHAWWQRGTITRRDLIRSAPFFAASLVFGLVTVWFELIKGQPAPLGTGFFARVATAATALWFYLGKALVPVNLTMIYPKWQIDPFSPRSYLPLAAALLAAGLLWRYRHRIGRGALFAAGSFVVMLLPVLGFVNQGFYRYSMVADHWQYPAIAGPIALAVAAAARWMPLRRRAVPVAALMLAGLFALCWQRAAVFRNSETLWRDTLAKNPAAWIAHNNLGTALAEQGRTDEALAHCRQALRLKPNEAELHNNLGALLTRLGRYEEGIAHLRHALRIRAGHAKTLSNLARAVAAQGRPAEAIALYQRALEINPHLMEAHYNLGTLLAAADNLDAAAGHLSAAVRIRPDSARAHYQLGTVLHRQGRLPEAAAHYGEAIRLQPELFEAHANLAQILAAQGEPQRAAMHFREALRLRPDAEAVRRALAELQTTLQREPR
jgi:tetratricopeptide (TPR) repeat protein